MARDRVMVYLICGSASDADQIRLALQTKLTTKLTSKYNASLTSFQAKPTEWWIIVDVSFPGRVDAVDVRDDIVNKWTSGSLRNKILAGSKVTVHTCSHDDGETAPYQSCQERSFELRSKP